MTPEEAIAKVDKMVYMLAMKYAIFLRQGKLSIDDLVQAGRMGVLKAHAKFDPSVNPHFPTYAGYWIRAYIRNECLDHGRTVRVPAQAQREAFHAGRPLSLRNADIDKMHDQLHAPAVEEDHTKLFRRTINTALGSLQPRMQTVIRMRFFDECTLEQIGTHLGVTRERARQLCEKALDQLSVHVPSHMKDYL